MKKILFLMLLLVLMSSTGFATEQTFTLKINKNESTIGVLCIEFEIVEGPFKRDRIWLYAVSELYKAVFERYLKPISTITARFDIDGQERLWPSQIISIDGKSIESLFRWLRGL